VAVREVSIVASSKTTSSVKTAGSRPLDNARRAKADEFYTQLDDISEELRHYRDQLRGKIILCNCDDPFESNFFKYFAANFNRLSLKKLIATSYDGSPIAGHGALFPEYDEGNGKRRKPKALAVTLDHVTDEDGDGAADVTDVELFLKRNKAARKSLQADGNYPGGDFRSAECIALLEEADIVVTNPPFSLFREYVAQLVEHGKKFLIIGNKNAIAYKDVFSLIQTNRLWIGTTRMGVDLLFDVPTDYAEAMIASGKAGSNYRIVDGLVKGRSPSVWFTNMDNPKRHEEIPLDQPYSPGAYPTYHNYPAIEVGKVSDIPADYMGEMGVPVTFLDKYNPEQFEIVGSNMTVGKPMSEMAPKGSFLQGGPAFYLANGDGTYRRLYERIVIRRRG
jgi:hypothetical protein